LNDPLQALELRVSFDKTLEQDATRVVATPRHVPQLNGLN
jgi:hypothetical protein